MAEKIYAKNFVFAGKSDAVKLPAYRTTLDAKSTKNLAYIDQTTVDGAEFGVENIWFFPGGPKEQKIMEANTENHDRFIGFFVNNYDDTHDLCGASVDITVDGEQHNVTESFVSFVPAGTEVGPIILKNVTKPIFFMLSQPCGTGIGKTWH